MTLVLRIGNIISHREGDMNNAPLPQWSIADTMADASTLNALAAWATALQAAEQKLDNDLKLLLDRMARLEQALGGVNIEDRLQKLESEIRDSVHSHQYHDDSDDDDEDEETDDEADSSPIGDTKRRRA